MLSCIVLLRLYNVVMDKEDSKLKQLINGKGFNVAEFSREMKLKSPQVVQNWEKRGIPKKYLVTVSDKLNVSIDHLVRM